MANLTESSIWETGIYQLETDDPVLGGPEGIDNLQAKQLANRTKYLNDNKAALASPTFTGTPAAPTAAPGTNSTQIATTAFIQAAISALVASSPAALDTLNELAAALGNDANFATTITNALALKASWAVIDPVLTQAGFTVDHNNINQLRDAILQISSNVGAIKSPADFLAFGNVTQSGLGTQANGDWPSTMNDGDRVLCVGQTTQTQNGWFNTHSGAWTRCTDADVSGEILPGAITVVAKGTNYADSFWEVSSDTSPIVPGTTVLVFTQKPSLFASSSEVLSGTNNTKVITPLTLLSGLLGAGGAGSSDYVILPYKDKSDGSRKNLIIQWGLTTSSASADVSVTFPIAFPNSCRAVLVVPGATGSGAFGGHNASSVTGFNLSAWINTSTRTAASTFWVSIGN